MTPLGDVSDRPGWVLTYSGFIHGVDCDLMGHLNTARYAAIFDAASWRMFGSLGYRWSATAVLGWADVRNVIDYYSEVSVDSEVYTLSLMSRVGQKSITLVHELWVKGQSSAAARFEAVVVQFDLRMRRAVAIAAEYRSQALLRVPSDSGSHNS